MCELIIDKIRHRKDVIKKKTEKINRRPLVLFISENENPEILEFLKEHNVNISYVCTWGKSGKTTFGDYCVSDLAEIIGEIGLDIHVFVSTNTTKNVDKAVEYLNRLGIDESQTYFGPTRNTYTDLYELRFQLFENSKRIQKVYDSLADEKSKQVFEKILTRLISPYVFHYEYEKEDFPQYFPAEYFVCHNEEIFLDAGVRNGDTSREFIDFVHGKYEKIIGFEADQDNYIEVIEKMKDVENTMFYNKALYSEATELRFESSRTSRTLGSAHISDTGDVIIQAINGDALDMNPTFVKMDIEGAEIAALNGMKNTIQNMKPKMAVCIYHSLSDFWEIPLKILEINPEYRISIRNHEHMYCLIESVCYAY